MANAFVHLKVHTEYSVSDGLVKVHELVERAVAQGMPAVAITDRTNLFALIKFYDACMSAGIKPIVGADLTLSDTEVDPAARHRCVVLACDEAGYRNIITLVSKAYTGGGQRGCVERSWLEAASSGVILLSGGARGDVGQALLRRDEVGARRIAQRWRDVFGDRYYLELERTRRDGDERYLVAAVELAADLDIPVVATNDVCFLARDDFEAHETRVCIQEGRTLNDPRRQRRYSEEQYFKSSAEMAALFEDIPEALANAVEIAKRCSVKIQLGSYFLPNYPVPGGVALDSYLRERAREGLTARLDATARRGRVLSSEQIDLYRNRIEREVDIINQMGFAGYFLIVMEFVNWAKSQRIPVGPGRGSGAGSLVAYSLGITDLDPLAYDLLFERFLNPERVSMPDFDIDFCMIGRDAVITHVAEMYGHASVGQIATFGTMAAKAVVRDVARVQGKPYGLADKLSKLIPFEVGMTLERAVAEASELRDFIADNDEVGEIMDMAYKLEGIVRNVGKHAGGVVIAPSLLTDFVPLYVDEASEGHVSQFDKDDVERAGLVKFDFLGLKTLTIIDWTVAAINEFAPAGADPLDITQIPLDDTRVFDLLKRAETTAVFQFESRGMQKLLEDAKPDRFEDIIALVALFRPGPMELIPDFVRRKHGQERVEYLDPRLVPILSPTYGIMVYQEQVMQIAQVIGGYSLGSADLLRRAMGKKKPEEMAKQRDIFTAGAMQNGVTKANAEQLFDLMEKFAGYGFNKSHAAAYALVSYQTAWLKAHHPEQFMAAVLTADMEHTDKIVTLVDEVRRAKLELEPPNINRSRYRFSVDGGRILYGLGAIRGIGEGTVAAVCDSRERQGPFVDLYDFCRRIDSKKANRRAVEALVRAGAMDAFKRDDESIDAVRGRLLAELDSAMQGADQLARNQASGISDMFGDPLAAPADDHGGAIRPRVIGRALSRRERLDAEKEALGLYLTGHPLDDYIAEIREFCPTRIADVRVERGTQVVAGHVFQNRTMRNKRGELLSFTVLDDGSGRIELSVYADVYEKHKAKIFKDAVLVAEGEVQQDDYNGSLKMKVGAIYTMDDARRRYADCLQIEVAGAASADLARRLRRLLAPHRQNVCPVAIAYRSPAAEGRLVLGPEWRVAPSDELLQSL
ncbi:MAG TPA: DNA polymerase III subunit alpha, partial [Pseudomonadales bacterium]|nr:DNA polymerase III subunit alpha [Pseudomonadales bacterium]